MLKRMKWNPRVYLFDEAIFILLAMFRLPGNAEEDEVKTKTALFLYTLFALLVIFWSLMVKV